jgi:hypothetical protein
MTDETDDLTGPLLDPADDAAITALLADLPPVDMPSDVAERVATALAAEVPLSGAVPAWAVGGATNVSVLPSQKERAQRKSTRNARILSGAAAVVLVVGAIAFGTQFSRNSGDGGETAGGAGATSDNASFAADATLLSESNTTYTEADLPQKVDGLVASASASQAPVTKWTPEATPAPSVPGPSSSTDVEDLAKTPLTVLGVCISKLGAAPAERPVAVDTGTWKASTGATLAVAVVVLPGANPARVDVFVVTAGCGDPAVVDDSYLVYYASVARR